MDGTSQPAAASVPLSTPLRDQDVLRRLSVHLECVQVEQVMVADLGWAAGGESKPFSGLHREEEMAASGHWAPG